MDTIMGHHTDHATPPVHRYKVTIAGESYFLVSDEPEEHVRAVARHVDELMRALANAGLTDDPKRICGTR